MTFEKYMETCRQLNVEPEESKIPPSIEDFPSYVHTGIRLFNSLPDTFTGGMEPVYNGKDITAITTLFEIYNIDPEDYVYVFEVIQFIDNRARRKAAADHKKAAAKGKGKK
jgi:hypothetical protein